MLERLKERVCRVNKELERFGLVRMGSGNVSAREPGSGQVAITPSGGQAEKMSLENMVVLAPTGEVLEGRLRPSRDAATHLYIYKHRPDVSAIVHTHSNFATAFAVAGKPIPVALAALAEEFAGPIPVGGYASLGEEDIGKEILRSIGKARVILMKQHGVFTFGPTPEEAYRSAVMVEDAAKTCYLALQLGPLTEILPDEVTRVHRIFHERFARED